MTGAARMTAKCNCAKRNDTMLIGCHALFANYARSAILIIYPVSFMEIWCEQQLIQTDVTSPASVSWYVLKVSASTRAARRHKWPEKKFPRTWNRNVWKQQKSVQIRQSSYCVTSPDCSSRIHQWYQNIRSVNLFQDSVPFTSISMKLSYSQ